jgi:CHAD domain-containing protein
MKPILRDKSRRKLNRVLRRLRRRLGPVRDLDVMLWHLQDLPANTPHVSAALWVAQHLACRRVDELKKVSGHSVQKELKKLGKWESVRREMEKAHGAADSLLAASIHDQLDAFVGKANHLTGNWPVVTWEPDDHGSAADDEVPFSEGLPAEMPGDLPFDLPFDLNQEDNDDDVGQEEEDDEDPKAQWADEQETDRDCDDLEDDFDNPFSDRADPHKLRIAGKSLRYTLEMAEHQVGNLPEQIVQAFKEMQDQLGLWHDYVMLSEQATRLTLDVGLAYHDTSLHIKVCALAQYAAERATDQLQRFEEQWKRSGDELVNAIRQVFPVTKEVKPKGHDAEIPF